MPPRQRLTARTRGLSATIDWSFSRRQSNLRDRPTQRATTCKERLFWASKNETEGPSGVIDFTFTPNVTLTADEFITATITPLVDNPTTTLSTVGFSTGNSPDNHSNKLGRVGVHVGEPKSGGAGRIAALRDHRDE